MMVWWDIVAVVNDLGKHEEDAPWVSEIIDSLLDTISAAGFINQFNLTAHRREIIKPALPEEYKRLAEDSYPPSPDWLFGEDLGEAVEKISKENKLTEKIFPRTKQGGIKP